MGHPFRGRSVKRFNRLLGAAAVLLGAAFFALLRAPMWESTLELDLGWMLSSLASLVDGRSGWEIVRLILSPAPAALEPPVVKAFLLLAIPSVGLKIRHLVLIAGLVHGANAFLLFQVARRLGLKPAAAFTAACFYFSLLVHFHAFLWPTAFQHLFAVFTILLLLNFYLKNWYGPALASALLASLQRSALIGLVLVLADILFCSGGDRVRRWRRWFPLFAASLAYPVWMLSAGVDGILAGMVLHSGFPARVRDLFLPAGATSSPIQSGLKYPVLFCLGILSLLGMGGFLRWMSGWKRGWKIGLGWLAGLLFGGFFLQGFQDKRQLLFLYNALGPFVTALTGFFSPFRTALGIGALEPSHHLIPPQISGAGIALSVLLLSLFWAGFASRRRRLFLPLVWYLFCLIFLLRHPYTSFPVVSPSRYFIYLSPAIGIVFGASAVWVYWKAVRILRCKPWVRDSVLIFGLTALCFSNLAAIRLAAWRGKLANTFYAYDDVRTARLIREDLSAFRGADRWTIAVEGVAPVPALQKIGGMEFSYLDPSRYDNLRIAMGQELGYSRIGRLEINPEQRIEVDRRYTLQQARLLDREGRRIDPFGRFWEEGFSELSAGRTEQAAARLGEAVRRRPFLLNYCLAPSLRDEDLRRLTGGLDFREWLDRISAHWRSDSLKFKAIRSMMEQELGEYAAALLALSFLESKAGHAEKSRYWLSRLWLLESDPEVLRGLLQKQPVVQADTGLSRHLLVSTLSEGWS